MTSDPIADMLTRVRNAIAARHPKVDVPASKVKAEIAVGRGKELRDKRRAVADRDARRQIERELKSRR